MKAIITWIRQLLIGGKQFTGWQYTNGRWEWRVTNRPSYWSGQVSDVWAWDRVLTQAEITHLYYSGDAARIPGGRKLI